MYILNKPYAKLLSMCSLFLMCIVFGLASCSDDDKTTNDPSLVTDPAIDKLEVLITEINELATNSTYGLRQGMYPDESKAILTDAVSTANRYILFIKYKNPSPTQAEKDEWVATVTNQIPIFESTIRVVDAPVSDAYLYVDGNNGGYIDFGYSDDYINFGGQGDQSFTIEMWVKISDYCNLTGEDNSTFLSTFAQKDGTGEFFSGWRVQSRTKNIVRGSVGIIDVNNDGRYLWEPGYTFSKKSEWVHVAFVYSDRGLDGNVAKRSVVYCNGEQTGDVINIDETERQYNSTNAQNIQMKMTAFGRFDLDGVTFKEYFSGYIRKIRIWKTAKDAAYILSSKEGTVILDSTDTNLVCAWDFEKSSYSNEIVDVTGRHTATLVGDYKWEDR